MRRVSHSGIPRRSFLRSIASGAVAAGSALLPGSTLAQANTDDKSVNYLVITYDDGPIEDYELTFPVHQDYDVPGCVAACPGRLDSDDSLNRDQLRAMYDAGWEVMSHTIDHRAIGEVQLTGDVAEGDTEIAVQSNVHGQYEGDPLALFDDNNETEATVVDRGESGDEQYLRLKEPIDVALSAANGGHVRYTRAFTREILSESKAQLEEIVGEDQVTGFVYPYERHDGLAAEVVPEYYEATPRAFMGNGLNATRESDPFSISREYYEEDRMDEDEIARFLDRVVTEPVFGILASHSQYDTLTEERIKTTIKMALERDIEIVTLQEALDTFDIVEAPKRTKETDDTGKTDEPNDEIDDTEKTDEPNDETNDADTNNSDDEGLMGLFNRIVSFFRSLFG